jgi:hypothetical protein
MNVITSRVYDVKSGNVTAIGWEPTDATPHAVYGDLTVTWHAGHRTTYTHVSSQRFGRLLAADSIGNYVEKRIKPNYAVAS